MLRAQSREDPADLFVIARVVGARRPIHLAAAAPKVRHDKAQPALTRQVGECQRIPAARGAFQAMEHHQQGRVVPCGRRNRGIEPIGIDKITIRCGPALAAVGNRPTLARAGT
jgi:hypothetical protein